MVVRVSHRVFELRFEEPVAIFEVCLCLLEVDRIDLPFRVLLLIFLVGDEVSADGHARKERDLALVVDWEVQELTRLILVGRR